MGISYEAILNAEEEFGIHDVKELSEKRNVIKLSAKEGDFALKKLKIHKENYLYSLDAIEHLNKNSFCATCNYVMNRNDVPYVIYNDEIYIMSKWINGRLADYSNLSDLRETTIALAKMHLASKGFIKSELSQPRQETTTWQERFTLRCKDIIRFEKIIKEKDTLTAFDKLYIANLNYYYELGVKVINMLNYTVYNDIFNEFKVCRGFCHHDIANHNVIINDEGICLIDFDYVYEDIGLHDLASLIIRNMKTCNWNLNKAIYILNCYNEVIPLNVDEIDVIKYFISFPQDFWQVGLQYYVEKQGWEEDVFLTKLMRFLIQREYRENFLKKFKSTKFTISSLEGGINYVKS